MRDDFALVVPMYVVAEVRDDQTVRTSFLSSPFSDECSLVLFSEELLAERWRDALADCLDVLCLNDWNDVLTHLGGMPDMVTSVAIDPKSEMLTDDERCLMPILSLEMVLARARREATGVWMER